MVSDSDTVNKMQYSVLDFVGNVGVLLLMVAYLLLQLNRLKNGLVYSVLNAFGASLIVISLLTNFNLSAFLMEVFWVLISFVGIYRHLRTRTVQS
jgi:multidrug transporter EmrE-like cation transporter